MGFKVLILDCDGVMFDSKQANKAFYEAILARLCLPPLEDEELEYVHASTAIQALAFLLERRGLHVDPEEIKRLIRSLSISYDPFIDLMKPMPHLRELLEGLPLGMKKAVCTNRTTTIRPLLERFGLGDYFDLVVSASDVKRPKPFPDSLLKIIESFLVTADKCLYVGDTVLDQEAARAISMPFVAYRNPHLSADYHVEDLLEVLEIIRSKTP